MPIKKQSPRLSDLAKQRQSKPTRTKVLPQWFAENPKRHREFLEYLAILDKRGVRVSAKDIAVDLRQVWPDFPVSHTALFQHLKSEGLR